MAFAIGLIDPEYTVFIRIEGYRSSVLIEMSLQAVPVGPGGRSGRKVQGSEAAGGIVNKHD